MKALDINLSILKKSTITGFKNEISNFKRTIQPD